MNEQFNKTAEEMMQSIRDMKMPENVHALAEDAVARGREAYDRASEVAKENAKAMEQVATVTSTGARSMNEKMMDVMASNADAAFDAAEAMVRSKTLPEAARIQADYMQQAMAQASEQTRDFLEMSTQLTRETVEVMSSAASKSMENVKA